MSGAALPYYLKKLNASTPRRKVTAIECYGGRTNFCTIHMQQFVPVYTKLEHFLFLGCVLASPSVDPSVGPSVGWCVGPLVGIMFFFINGFLCENHRGGTSLTLLNVLGVLNVLSAPKDASLACWVLFNLFSSYALVAL